ncbi:O-Glycosyl hydrolases family 17 protein [Striga hermonthica]|uniref:O-Glycosyl hydrolases family 17 protein n=1 Tax=Striga hermonthica TaxID=68872 RepID=A0A9N7MQR3_STRHE|nr:O-Glycosyl hydrolases family 17 protein [Striga hermonthica]
MASKLINFHSPSSYSYAAALFIAAMSCTNVLVTEGVIGVNWGRKNAQRLIPSVVVDLLLQNRVPAARIYTTETDILEAFVGSGINLAINIFDASKVATYEDARSTVDRRSAWFDPSNITRVYVGNQMFAPILNDTRQQSKVVDMLNNTQRALNDAGYSHVKATLTHPFFVLNHNFTRPSEAEISVSVHEQFMRYLDIIKASGAPVCIDLFPVEIVRALGIHDFDFAFADNRSTHIVTDVGGAVYTNAFEFMYDSFMWALEKVGAHEVEVVVTQIGWPTDGHPNASAANAERFYKALLPLVSSGRGTPKRPGKHIDIYVHALTDENKNPPGVPYGRHWGIYRSNGEPKYRVDLTGQGRDVLPARARDINRMPERWCVLDPSLADDERVEAEYMVACSGGDCTSMYTGGSCSGLDKWENVSYAFNMYFQAKFQNEKECTFGGLGRVVTEDPSTGSCVFPVEVVKGQQNNFAPKRAEGSRVHEVPGFDMILVLLVSTLWAFVE